MSINQGGITRRDMLRGSALLVGSSALGALVGCAPSAEQGPEAQGGGQEALSQTAPSFMVAPDPVDESQVTEVVVADVVVVGCGVAGLAAARSAQEAGASVAVIEKSESFNCRSGQYAVYNSSIQRANGMDYDVDAAIENLMVCMGYRADQRLWKLWRDSSGEAFDWFLEPANGDVDLLPMDAMAYGSASISLQPLHYPAPEAYDPANETWPSYPEASFAFVPSQRPIMELNFKAAQDAGVDFHFATWARQLIRPNNEGPVLGVIAQTKEGGYVKFEASKAVILAAGGYGHNTEMVQYYTGKALECPMWFDVDANGEFTNQGEGQMMGMWAGALMEDGPHIQGNHSLGGALGVDGFFMCDLAGRRFMNEDAGGQQLTNRLMRLPGLSCWSVFDDDYPIHVEFMGCSHGSVNHVVSADRLPGLEGAEMTIGRHAITSREAVEAQSLKADTLEELADLMGLPADAKVRFLAEVERYNELCAKGVDEDFGKSSSRMFGILKAPFYASQVAPGPMLECMGGLVIDSESMLVLDTAFAPIEGLYAVGNNMGGRFLVDYPTTLAGMSHSTCLTFGYLAGRAAAKA